MLIIVRVLIIEGEYTMKILNNICFMCGASASDGIIVNGERICRACEEKIINTAVADSDYDVYKDQVKDILFDEHARK